MLELEDVKEFLDVLSSSPIGRSSRWYFWLVALCFLSAYATLAIVSLLSTFPLLGQLGLIACCVGPLWPFYFE